MSLELNHECSGCADSPKTDECYCEKCRDSYAADAYEAGKEAGYKEGYADAEKELTPEDHTT